MHSQAAYQQYQKVQVETATPGSLLIMLYQSCIKFLKLAQISIEAKDVERANTNLVKAQNIIYELMSTLDHEKGGEIADNLQNLYQFMLDQLVQANMQKDAEKVLIVENLMTELLATWQQVVNNT